VTSCTFFSLNIFHASVEKFMLRFISFFKHIQSAFLIILYFSWPTFRQVIQFSFMAQWKLLISQSRSTDFLKPTTRQSNFSPWRYGHRMMRKRTSNFLLPPPTYSFLIFCLAFYSISTIIIIFSFPLLLSNLKTFKRKRWEGTVFNFPFSFQIIAITA
jgi:hypothetical protein